MSLSTVVLGIDGLMVICDRDHPLHPAAHRIAVVGPSEGGWVGTKILP